MSEGRKPSSGLAVAQTWWSRPAYSAPWSQVAVAEQRLDGADVGAGLQQVGGEAVAQRVRGDRLAESRLRPGRSAGDLAAHGVIGLPGDRRGTASARPGLRQ